MVVGFASHNFQIPRHSWTIIAYSPRYPLGMHSSVPETLSQKAFRSFGPVIALLVASRGSEKLKPRRLGIHDMGFTIKSALDYAVA